MGKSRLGIPGLTPQKMAKNQNETALKPGKPAGEISQEAFDAYSEDVKKAQTLVSVKGRKRQTPLERGWTSANPQGRKFGPPESSDPDENMEDFDTILISTTMLTSMTSLFGRVRKQRICMICGNRDGLLGYASVKAKVGAGPSLFRRAMNRAGNQVCFIDRYEDRTVFHDFYSQFGRTRMFVQQKPPGFGVSAHRIIQAACDLVGIKDLRAVIDGNINPINVLKCFMLGLLRQRTHQALANEKRLHLVELRSEMGNFPLVSEKFDISLSVEPIATKYGQHRQSCAGSFSFFKIRLLFRWWPVLKMAW